MTAPIPLTAPDGTVYAYACATCLRIAGGIERMQRIYSPDDVAYLASHSLRKADGCCTCRRCEQPFVPSSFDFYCPTCQPLEDAEYAERMAEAETERAAQLAAREESLAKALDRVAAESLESAMSDLSEEHYCAGWMSGLETDLWSMLEGGDRRYGLGEVSTEDVAKLRELAAKAGGWWEHNRFIPIDEWRATYAKHVEDLDALRKACAVAEGGAL